MIPRIHSSTGKALVVFGKPDGDPVDGRNLGSGGYLIEGDRPDDATGWAVAGAGDGDGRDDVIVGAPRIYAGGSGHSFVVYGKPGTGPVSLTKLRKGHNRRGFALKGEATRDAAGSAVDGIGDLNGDGLDDLVVVSKRATYRKRTGAGKAYVIHGRAYNNRVRLDDLGNKGFVIGGPFKGGLLETVAGPGDINGNGIVDIVIGAGTGIRAYGVFGR